MGVISTIAVIFLALFSLFLAAATSVTTIAFELNSEADLPRFHAENIPLLFVCIIIVSAILIFIRRNTVLLSDRSTDSPHKKRFPGGRLSACVLTAVSAFCLFLILGVHGLATTDALTLDGIINSFMQGDYSSLTEPGGYLFIYPFQLGYVAIGQLLYILAGPSNYLVYQLLNLVSILTVLVCLYMITDELFPGGSTSAMAVILSCGFFCLYVHSTFIYSDIWSLAPQSAAIYMLLLGFRRGKMRFYAAGALFAGFAVILKHNCYILMIAAILILLLRALFSEDGSFRTREIMAAILVIAAVYIFPLAVNLSYLAFTDIDTIPEGVPSSTYIAMGLQEAETSNGWYNGYTVKTYRETDYDHDETARIGREEISSRINLFAHHPKYTVKFFAGKLLSQWADPTCASMRELELTSRHTEKHSALIESIIYGRGRNILSFIMNVFESLMYIGFSVYLINLIKKGSLLKDRGRLFITAYSGEVLILLFIIGGIIFHTFWEGSSRYILRYYVCILPFASKGWMMITEKLSGGEFFSKIESHKDIGENCQG